MDTNTLLLVVMAGFFFGWMVNHAISRGFGWGRSFLYGAVTYGLLAVLVVWMKPPGEQAQTPTVADLAMLGGAVAVAGGLILAVLVRLGRRHRQKLLRRLQESRKPDGA